MAEWQKLNYIGLANLASQYLEVVEKNDCLNIDKALEYWDLYKSLKDFAIKNLQGAELEYFATSL